MLEKQKPTLRAPLLIILLIVSILSFGYYSESGITGMVTQITGDMVKVTGMATYYVQDKLGGAYIDVDASSEAEARKIAIEDYSITPGTITTDPKPTGTSTRYIVKFSDGTTYPITTISKERAEASGKKLAPKLGKTYDSVSQPKYRVYLSDTVYNDVEAPSAAAAIKLVQDEYAKQDVTVTPTKTEEVTTQLAVQDATKDYKTYVITPKDGSPLTVKANDQSAAERVANNLILGDKTVEEQKYKIIYGDKSYVVPESDKASEIVALSALGISYTIKPVTGKEAEQEGKLINYEITLNDDTTINKMLVDDDAARQFINSIADTEIGKGATFQRKISIEEARAAGYRDSGFTLEDGKTPLFTKDGIKFYQNPIDQPGETKDTLYKSYDIGLDSNEDGEGDIKVIEQYTTQTNAQPKFTSAEIGGIQINDRTTLNEIKASVGSEGTISKEMGLIVTRRDNRPFQAFELSYDQNKNLELKVILSYGNAYQKDDKVISEREWNALSEEEQDKYTPINMVASVKGERQLSGKRIILVGETKIKDGKIVYEAHEFDEDGEVVMFHYREGWTYNNEGTLLILNKDGDPVDMFGKKLEESQLTEAQKELLPEARNSQSQAASRRWFADFEFKLSQYKGLAGWSQLIFSDEELAEWREGVDKLFSTFYLGTDYWSSAICSKYIPKQQKGLLTMKTKDGLFDIVAHVEGEKAVIPSPEGTQYLYKFTLSVRNPRYSRYDELRFNVYLYGERTVQLYPQSIEVKDGESFTRGSGKRENGEVTYDKQHGKPIVQYSNVLYNKICIKFDSGIINAEGDREDTVCNSIVEYKGSPTKYQQRVTTAEGTTTTPGEPYQEAEF